MSITSRVKFGGDSLLGAAQKIEGWGKRRKRTGLTALGSESGYPVFGAPSSARNYNLIGLLMFSNVVFNLTDMATTLFALGDGLREGNALVLGLSAAFGLGLFASLALVKVLFVTAAAVIAIFGIRSTSERGRSLALSCLASSTLLFLCVSLNNVFWILA